MKFFRRFSPSLLSILALGLASMAFLPISNEPVFARQSSLMYCVVTVNGGVKTDPLPGAYMKPQSHTYYSELYAGPDRDAEFLAWARRHYGKDWIVNPYLEGPPLNHDCFTSTPEFFQTLLDGLKDYPYATFTNWPAVPPDPQ